MAATNWLKESTGIDIGSYSTAEQERTYNAVSERVGKAEIDNSGAALGVMQSLYPGDAKFRAAFAEKVIRTCPTSWRRRQPPTCRSRPRKPRTWTPTR